MRLAWVLLAAMACGKGNDTKTTDKPTDKPAGGTPSAGTAIPTPKKSVTGELHLTGALEGTYKWKDDFAVDSCGWVDSTKVGALGATLSDGKDSFVSITAIQHDDGKHTITFGGGKIKLPHASSMTGEAGFEMTGTDHGDDSTVAVTFKHAAVSADGQTVTIDGELAGNCKYSR